MKACKINLKAGFHPLGFAEGAAVEQVIGLRVNEALIGDLTPAAALNTAAAEIEAIFAKSGRTTCQLPALVE